MKIIAIASAAMLATGLASAASATTNLVVNGSFEATSFPTRVDFYQNVPGWTLKLRGPSSGINYLVPPGCADKGAVCGPGIRVYPGFPTVSPDGGNFVLSDGDPSFSRELSQTISGLTIGKLYTVRFYQAAGQQNNFTGPTTECWQVTFGTDTQLSHQFSLPQGGTGPWELQKLSFYATSVSQKLTFLAVGTPRGAPPISFLDGVSINVPEPSTWAMLIAGFGLVGAAARRRRTATVAA